VGAASATISGDGPRVRAVSSEGNRASLYRSSHLLPKQGVHRAAIMCRKTLEGICSAHGVKTSGSLAVQLKKLKDNGTIENRLFEWAEALRTTGNEAAHGVELVISAQDAQDTLEFTDALIQYVFTYRDKFEAFKNRRAKAELAEASAPPPN
jgi:hypothetical protein